MGIHSSTQPTIFLYFRANTPYDYDRFIIAIAVMLTTVITPHVNYSLTAFA
ncbi:hypothetical protein [Nostoc sp. CALU 546]|uniref:hypothetical protein n=1 Tax=Nostoc sp. CALU 546 TaxID=1867241 RepID=UPI003B670314